MVLLMVLEVEEMEVEGIELEEEGIEAETEEEFEGRGG